MKKKSAIGRTVSGILRTTGTVRWKLVLYDLILFVLICGGMIFLHPSVESSYGWKMIIEQTVLGTVILFGTRLFFGCYRHIIRYGGYEAIFSMIAADAVAFVLDYAIDRFTPIPYIRFTLMLSIFCINLLVDITLRLIYAALYRIAMQSRDAELVNYAVKVLNIFGYEFGKHDEEDRAADGIEPQHVAVMGAGRLGVSLVNDVRARKNSVFVPVLFIDVDKRKTGRELLGLPVIHENDVTEEFLKSKGISEIVIAIESMSPEQKRRIFEEYRDSDIQIRVYDFPVTSSAGSGKRMLRNFEIEELMPRKTINVNNSETDAFYAGKTVLITGGGGSIGSELARQIAAMKPKKLVIADFAENSTYEVLRELQFRFGAELDVTVEIVNVCDRSSLETVFRKYRPEAVLHAAAHKHVPFMEHNVCEAIRNNVFGTKNTAELSILYGVSRFVLISTDKAVNPTNVMGATKRVCEMIVRAYSEDCTNVFAEAREAGTGDPDITESRTQFCAVRFGNVIGSAGSVVPLFRRQIERGGPVTITDKRIVRYFMTIPEAASLVLESGAKAQNGELFVLDMGQPVRILELAENMIRLSGYEPYRDIQIRETGLRPGEKLYEELLIKSETLGRTDNELIFTETDVPLSAEDLEKRLDALWESAISDDDLAAKNTLKACVPTFREPEEVNIGVEKE